MLIEKEVARPGTTWYIDPQTGLPAKANFTADTLKYWHDQGNAMRAAGLSIPVPFEHQPDATKALTPAQRAAYNTKNNAGWVERYKMKTIKDDQGQDVQALFSDVDIPDPKVARSLPHTIRYTSPYISSFVDGNGRSWNGVITHLALTTRPRILKQQPFPTLAAAMSLAGNLIDQPLEPAKMPKEAKGFFFSKAGLLKKQQTGSLAPVYPVAFALYSGIGLAQDVPVDKEKKPRPEVDVENEPEKAFVDEDGDVSIYEVLADLLEAVGVPVGDITPDNFCQKVYEATMSKVKGGAESMTPSVDRKPGEQKTPLIQEQPPLYMSNEAIQEIKDPTQKAMALSIVQLQQENAAQKARSDKLEKMALESAKSRRQQRIDRLMKKLSPAARQHLTAMTATASFSLGEDGKVNDSLEQALTMLEATVPDLPKLLTQDAASFSEVPHPKEYQGEMSKERAQEVANEASFNGGIRTQPNYKRTNGYNIPAPGRTG